MVSGEAEGPGPGRYARQTLRRCIICRESSSLNRWERKKKGCGNNGECPSTDWESDQHYVIPTVRMFSLADLSLNFAHAQRPRRLFPTSVSGRGWEWIQQRQCFFAHLPWFNVQRSGFARSSLHLFCLSSPALISTSWPWISDTLSSEPVTNREAHETRRMIHDKQRRWAELFVMRVEFRIEILGSVFKWCV